MFEGKLKIKTVNRNSVNQNVKCSFKKFSLYKI